MKTPNITTTTILSSTLLLISCTLISCTQNPSNQSNSNKTFDLSKYDNPNQNQINNMTSKSSYASPSYADYNYNRACPRLLQKEVDSSLITRTKEQMHHGQYCDYYIYPKIGQTLSITSRNSTIKVILVMPEFYDFANGAYSIKANRRHVIRVTYNGIENMPDDFVYDIDFSLN